MVGWWDSSFKFLTWSQIQDAGTYTPISIKVASEKRYLIVVSLVNYVPATSLET